MLYNSSNNCFSEMAFIFPCLICSACLIPFNTRFATADFVLVFFGLFSIDINSIAYLKRLRCVSSYPENTIVRGTQRTQRIHEGHEEVHLNIKQPSRIKILVEQLPFNFLHLHNISGLTFGRCNIHQLQQIFLV